MKPTSEACPQCGELKSKVAALEAEVLQLRASLAAANKNSATSSKPPSSDIVKPKPPVPSDGAKRAIGGQPGHPQHLRQPFGPEQITHSHFHDLDACPDCGGALQAGSTPPRLVQQMDIQKAPLIVEQHTQPSYWCPQCQKNCRAPLPLAIERGGLLGPNLTALIAFMKGSCHASFSTIRTFLRDVMGVTVARSTLANTLAKVSQALDGPYDELLLLLPKEKSLNVDETGHKCNQELWWTWCLRADLYTLFKIDAHRNSEVLMTVLGQEFAGVLGCDYFSAYRKYMRLSGVAVQFCLAHLIRDMKFLTTLPDAGTKAYGQRLCAAMKELFEVFHRREEMSEKLFEEKLKGSRDQVLAVGAANVPATQQAQNMAKRFEKHGASFFTFVTTPNVEPTNNLAEQAIRFVVIDRHITQGTRGETGRQWSERIWTVIATCMRQGRSVLDYLQECVRNWFDGNPSTSLLSTASV